MEHVAGEGGSRVEKRDVHFVVVSQDSCKGFGGHWCLPLDFLRLLSELKI